MYEWPASKFTEFYAAYARRKIADELSLKRSLEIAALWGNPNLDSEKDPQLRAKTMKEVDQAYSKAIAGLYEQLEEEQIAEIPEDDPFWKAAQTGLEERKLPASS